MGDTTRHGQVIVTIGPVRKRVVLKWAHTMPCHPFDAHLYDTRAKLWPTELATSPANPWLLDLDRTAQIAAKIAFMSTVHLTVSITLFI
jgi:hypothetical protein